MPSEMRLKYDTIGGWSIIKLEIIQKYAQAYSEILSKQRKVNLYHVYIDAFAGAGKHRRKDTGDFVPGSPQIALDITPPFKEYHFVDIDSEKANELLLLTAQRPEAHVHYGDCNEILLTKVFPEIDYKNFRRGLCLLDPYGLHLKWEVIKTAGHIKSIEMFLNFPIADMNRNVLYHNPSKVRPAEIQRMNNYWGDESWREEAYITQNDMFGSEVMLKQGNEKIVSAFRERLINVAGFQYVPRPLPMRTSTRSIVYYLFFASQKPVAAHIVSDIFSKYR